MSTSTLNPNYSRLRLWQLISPTLPIGMFAWSQGLEYVVDARWVTNQDQARDWISAQLRFNLLYLDLPLLKRFYQAWESSDQEMLLYWSQYLVAAREAQELNIEDAQLGQSLAKILLTLGVLQAEPWLKHEFINYPLMFALACQAWGVEVNDCALGFAWSYCENQVAAAIKLIPLGHSSGQVLLSQLALELDSVVEQALVLPDSEIGSSLPGFGIACARHETQYTRLFRS